MNKFIKAIGLVALASIIAAAPAYGATEQIGGEQVRVSGIVEPNTMVTIQVFKGELNDSINGETILGVDKPDYLDYIVAHKQTKADGSGAYSFDFNINLGTGYYSIYTATSEGMQAPEEFMFISDRDFKNLIDNINSATEAYDNDEDYENDVKSLISNNPYALGVTAAELDAVDISGFANVIFGTKNDTALDKNDREAVWDLIDKVYFVEQLNEGKIGNIYNYTTVADLETIGSAVVDGETVYWCDRSFAKLSPFQTDFTARLSEKSFASVKKYDEAITEAFVLATVKNPNGNGNVGRVITAFADKIGVDSAKGNDDIWGALAGKDYKDYAALKYAFNNPPENEEDDDDNRYTGGGFSSGGGGGTVTIKPAEKEENPSSQPSQTKDIFDDIAGVDWARDAIVKLVGKGILSGDGDGNFRPNDTITRAEFCKLIIEAFLPDREGTDIDFSDVADDAWYRDYIRRAFAAGVANGIGNGRFGADAPISRQDMAVMTYNAMIAAGRTVNVDTDSIFNDDASIADYARDAVYALKNMGAVNGMDDGGYAPLGTATRAQAAKIVGALLSE